MKHLLQGHLSPPGCAETSISILDMLCCKHASGRNQRFAFPDRLSCALATVLHE